MANTKTGKQRIGRDQIDPVIGTRRRTDSTIVITYPMDGSTVNGNAVAATGTAPLTIPNVSGALARKDDPTKSVTGTTLTPPSPWTIFFSEDKVKSLFKPGETELVVVLTVKDTSGVATPQTSTFTIDRASALGGKLTIPEAAVQLTPDPTLGGTTVTCPFTSSGEAPPGPLFAFIAKPGGPPIPGLVIQLATDPSDEFVFLWEGVPPGSGYAIYYQTMGNPVQYATDGPITVQAP